MHAGIAIYVKHLTIILNLNFAFLPYIRGTLPFFQRSFAVLLYVSFFKEFYSDSHEIYEIDDAIEHLSDYSVISLQFIDILLLIPKILENDFRDFVINEN